MLNKSINLDLTEGKISYRLWAFAIPLMLGNVFQQLYNLVDTWVVGRYVGKNALAAVGSTYTLITFLTSIIIGLCLGSSAFVSMAFGQKKEAVIRNGIFISFVIVAFFTIMLVAGTYVLLTPILEVLNIPDNVCGDMKIYLIYCLGGFAGIFLYNFFANILRSVGNSFAPLCFLIVSVLINIVLDIYFVKNMNMGIKGAAIATVISQYLSGVGILVYFLIKYPQYHVGTDDMKIEFANLKNIMSLSGFTCLQQSVMNLGILMVQGIVNGFGTNVMAAFAIAVKIDTIAYMPVQDYGNAFSVFVAQNYGAGKTKRIRDGIRQSIISITAFCLAISTAIYCFAGNLMKIFINGQNSPEIIRIGAGYLRIEGTFYIGIGILFMLYGYYRAVNQPVMSVVLTVISLGTRVILAYSLSSVCGVTGIWAAIPIGWFLADAVGLAIMKRSKF